MASHEKAKAARERILKTYLPKGEELFTWREEEEKKDSTSEAAISALEEVHIEESKGPGVHERARLAR